MGFQRLISLTGILPLCLHVMMATSHSLLVVLTLHGCCDVDFSPIKVVKVFKALKPKNPMVWMDSQIYYLKKLANVLCEPLAFIFQSSFRSHVLPTCCLHAVVTPVFTKGLTSNPGNYRPISLTCVCCRVMERIINLELLNYLYQHIWSNIKIPTWVFT